MLMMHAASPRIAHITRDWAAYLCGASAVFGILYMLFAATLTRRFLARDCAEPSSFPAVTIVKPLHGDEEALLENLSGFCKQDYPGPVQYLFGVHDENDPALDVVLRLRQLHPAADISMLIDSRLYGPNRKMSNILNMLPSAQHDILVFADSDVGVGSEYLRGVVGELQKPGVGLVTCLYRGLPDPGFWPRLSAKASNYHFLPSVVMGMALGLARPCFGQTIALRRATLDAIGGFAQFTHHLAEDHAIGEAVRRLGQAVVVPPVIVTHACVEKTAAQLISHELRWSRTIRTIAPAGHLGSILTHPFAFSLLTIALSGAAAWAWTVTIAALVARLVLLLQVDRALRQVSKELWLLPMWDIVGFAIFVSSFFSTHVRWRGFYFKVGRDGILHPVGERYERSTPYSAPSATPAATPAVSDLARVK
ncbi:bacteriohopanetetrol glucosamine biosynthesis glycosyltransferase HpnI [Caballeronia sp.]|uniref:bacteriohopanetetrol glucosamine biosynthesis glycosyltransferase HpnI n=1 Tax=Caballeronia sp. TaxID=1931223 RepID=UPI003C702F93